VEGDTDHERLTRDGAPALLLGLEALELSPGDLVGRYYVLERIGAGGMGVVYGAFDPDLDRKIALKVLLPERLDGEAGSRGHARLIREAKAMAKLSHPNVITVHDVGVFESRVFVAMEFVDGKTLKQWFETSPPWQEVVRCMIGAGRGLAAAHAKGLVHRDFKPDNVLIGPDGRARVLDFGLARTAAELPSDLPEEELLDTGDPGDRITRTGGLTGTPAYMAPEQYLGKPLDPRTDQFAFCVALWEGLHGARPFQGSSNAALGMAVCAGTVTPPPANSPVSTRVQRALERGLSLDPATRFPSMEALLAELDQAASSSLRPLWLGIGAVGLTLGAFAALSDPATDPCDAGAQQLSEAWNTDRAAALRQGFQRSGASFAASSADAVVEQLDAYAHRWQQAYDDACAATHEHKTQSAHVFDLRAGCLNQHLQAVHATVDTLSSPDTSAVQKGPRAVASLPPVDICASADSIDLWAPPPASPDLAQRVQALRERLAALRAEVQLGIDDAVGTETTALLLEAQTTEHGPLIAEAQFLAARFAIVSGRHTEGVALLEDTMASALASDHDRLLALALTQLTQATGILLSDYDAARRWSRQAKAAVERLGQGGSEAADFHAVMCKLLADKDQTDEALPHCHRTVELAEALHGKDSVGSASAYEDLGIAYFYGKRSDEALEQFERARDAYAHGAGESHPALARIANSLAAVCYQTRGAKPCVDAFAEGLRLTRAAYGETHPMTADFQNNLAQMLVESERFEEARRLADGALQTRRAISEDPHPGIAASLRILAVVDQHEGALAKAEEKLEQALAIVYETRGEEHRDVFSMRQQLARLLTDKGDVEGARAHAEACVQLSKRVGTDARDMTALLKTLPQPSEDASNDAERSAGTR
jgi:tetratricopeptide (TPR) repeat protein